jgi:hypothetical protein
MEGFSFVIPVTGLNRPNTGKEDDDECVWWTDRLSLNIVFILWAKYSRAEGVTKNRTTVALRAVSGADPSSCDV